MEESGCYGSCCVVCKSLELPVVYPISCAAAVAERGAQPAAQTENWQLAGMHMALTWEDLGELE